MTIPMVDPRTLAAACLLSTSAAAGTVPYPNPILTEHGLVLYVNDRARPEYRPLDGVDQWLAGKGAHLRAAEGVEWRAAPDGPETRHTHHNRPTFPLPPGLIDNPACDRAQVQPWFCDVPREPEDPKPHAPIPLPAGLWLMLAALAALGAAHIRRRDGS